MNALQATVVIGSLGTGGAERMACELANGLTAIGEQVTVLTLDAAVPDHFVLDAGVRRSAINIYWPARNAVHAASSAARRLLLLRRAIVATKPDVVLSLGDVINVRTLIALIGTGIPVVVSERSNPSKHPIGARWERLRRTTYRWAACVVLQTTAVAAWARAFVPSARIEVIPNFTRVAASSRCGVAPDAPGIILSVGRLGREKGHDLLVDAFARSGLHADGWSLAFVGDGPERGQLLRQAETLGIDAHLLLPGKTDNVEGWLRSASIFVLPSRYEGFPNALLEAMAAGLPCVAFDCDFGPRDLIDSGRNGLLVAPEDTRALCAALGRLAREPAERTRLANEAVKVVERYSRDVVLRQWAGVLRRTARGRPLASKSGCSSAQADRS